MSYHYRHLVGTALEYFFYYIVGFGAVSNSGKLFYVFSRLRPPSLQIDYDINSVE